MDCGGCRPSLEPVKALKLLKHARRLPSMAAADPVQSVVGTARRGLRGRQFAVCCHFTSVCCTTRCCVLELPEMPRSASVDQKNDDWLKAWRWRVVQKNFL